MTVEPIHRGAQLAPADPFSLPAAAPALTVQRAASSDQFDRMGKWLELFMATAEVAKHLAQSAFIPDAMRGKPADVAAAMMKGLELGIDPLDALANMHVVKGKVGFYAEFMRRRIIEAGHEIEFLETTDDRCKIRGRRAGSEAWQTVVFTAENARKAKIDLGNYPADKLVARASSRLCKRVFPEVLAGMPTVEDVIDGVVDELDPVEDAAAPVASGSRAVLQRKPRTRRATAVRAEPAPAAPASDLDDFTPPAEPARTAIGRAEPEPDPAPSDEPDGPASAAQNRKMHALFRNADVTERDDRLALTSHILGYRLDTSAGMTVTEASKVIDTLSRWEEHGSTETEVREILNQAALADTTTEEN